MTSLDVAADAAPQPVLAQDADQSWKLGMLACIVDSSSDAILSTSLDGRILSWNEGASRLFGYKASEVIAQPLSLTIPPDRQAEARQLLERVRRGDHIEQFDTVRLTSSGKRTPVCLTILPIRDAHGAIIGASQVARHSIRRRRTDHAAFESKKLLLTEVNVLAKLNQWSTRLWHSASLEQGLELILEAVMELLAADKGNVQLVDASGRVLSIVAQRGFEQAILERFREVCAGDDCACGRALRCGERIVVEDVDTDTRFESMRSIGQACGFRSVISIPLAAMDGTPLGMVSAHFRAVHRPSEQELDRLEPYLRQAGDFIRRCRMEDRLRQSEQALRAADQRKDEFLAQLAHELRNPLAPIRYALASSRKAGLTPEQHKRAEEVIERQVAYMSRLLDDLLDISRITRGTLELKRSPIELSVLILSAIETAQPFMDAKHHTLALDLPKRALLINADALRLSQVFSNLLINAAKYTDPGGRIRLRAVREGNDVVVAIRDNGIGIAADMMPRLFTMFAQAHDALGRGADGMGVGLALVRGLVTLHGGSVEVHSEGPGSGSEFVVRLPVGTPQLTDTDIVAAAAVRSPAARLKVLVVDDNRDAADSCAVLLKLSGHVVRTAYSGRRALERAESFRPHALLLDIGLPDLDGYQLARQIRAQPWGRDTVLIAVTGWGQEENRRRAMDAGFDHHLTKPIAAETVEAILQSLAAVFARSKRKTRTSRTSNAS